LETATSGIEISGTAATRASGRIIESGATAPACSPQRFRHSGAADQAGNDASLGVDFRQQQRWPFLQHFIA
jgi:hypothetical protein